MGQQQLLLLVLGAIIIGVALVAGIGLFMAGAEQSVKEELVSQSVTIASNAQQFYKKPTAMGGGGNTFTGYVIPGKMATATNGSFSIAAGDQTVTLTAIPLADLNYDWSVTTTITVDSIVTVVF